MRRLVVGSGAAASFVLGVAPDARADDRTGVLQGTHSQRESPQNFTFELRFAPYKPSVDSDPKLNGTPYFDTFGDAPHLYFGAELDWEAFRIPHLGTVGPGYGLGFVTMSRPARLLDSRGGQSSENTSLDIFPMQLVAVLRADLLMRDFHIPLVPYLKAGGALAFWRAYTDAGTSSSGGITGKGHTLGTYTAIGLSFDMNVLDERAAREFDNSLGVNHTYLFAEYFSSDLTGIGQTNVLRVGTTAFAFGLSFEF